MKIALLPNFHFWKEDWAVGTQVFDFPKISQPKRCNAILDLHGLLILFIIILSSTSYTKTYLFLFLK